MSRVNKKQLKQLKVGEKYTYKQMCDMGIFDKSCTGKQKTLQIEEFDQYVTYEKLSKPRGTFLIKEIRLDVEIEEKKKGGSKAVYSESLKPQLIFALSEIVKEDGEGVLLVNKSSLYKRLGLIGEDFTYYKTHRDTLWYKEKVPYAIQNTFFNGTTKKCESAVRTALKELRTEALADSSENVTIVKPLFQEVREATVLESKTILKIEKEVFKSMGRKDLKDIFIHNEMDKFFDYIKPRIAKELKIDFYFKGYKIITSSEFKEILLSIKELNNLREEANKLMKKSIDKSSEKAREKGLKRIQELEQKAEKTLGRLKDIDNVELSKLYMQEGNDNYFDFIDKLKELCMTLKAIEPKK